MKRKLIIHVGMEKTGTSSIQLTSQQNIEQLKVNGISYLGLMLDKTPKKIFDWQNPRGWTQCITLDKKRFNRELVHLFNEIDNSTDDKIHTFLWSNESLFNRLHFIDIAIDWLNKNFDLHVVGYVRKPDAWIQSAYLQWGIKHKTYKGSMKSFAEWTGDKNFPALEFVTKWKMAVLNTSFYNFDSVRNITEHFFLECLNLKTDKIDVMRLNDTPTAAQLALFTLFNSSFNEEVLPYRIEKLFNSNSICTDKETLEELSNLVPNQEELDRYCDSVSEETKALNSLLVYSDTKLSHSNEGYKLKKVEYNQSSINLELFKLCLSMSERIDKLEALLRQK